MKLRLILLIVIIGFSANAQTLKPAFYYCIDHPQKTLYYAEGNATVKPKLENIDYYQYGFMKWQGWIAKSWKGLDYQITFITTKNKAQVAEIKNALLLNYSQKGYTRKIVPMPYPMVPYQGYRKDGTH